MCFYIKIIYVNKNQLKAQLHTIFQSLIKIKKEERGVWILAIKEHAHPCCGAPH